MAKGNKKPNNISNSSKQQQQTQQPTAGGKKRKLAATSGGAFPLTQVVCVLVLALLCFYAWPSAQPATPKPATRLVKSMRSVSKKHPVTKPLADPESFGMTCERRKASELSVEEYLRVYDAKKPVIIEGAMEGMGAIQKWSKEWFVKHYGKARVVMKVHADSPHAAIHTRK